MVDSSEKLEETASIPSILEEQANRQLTTAFKPAAAREALQRARCHLIRLLIDTKAGSRA